MCSLFNRHVGQITVLGSYLPFASETRFHWLYKCGKHCLTQSKIIPNVPEMADVNHRRFSLKLMGLELPYIWCLHHLSTLYLVNQLLAKSLQITYCNWVLYPLIVQHRYWNSPILTHSVPRFTVYVFSMVISQSTLSHTRGKSQFI